MMQFGRGRVATVVTWILAASGCRDTVAATECTNGCACEIDSDCTDPVTSCDQGTCSCSPGYAVDEGGACVWSGLLVNPGFTTTGGWDLGPGVTIEPDRFPGTQTIDLGMAVFSGQAVCGMSRLSQRVTLPKFSRSEPLVVVGAGAFSFGSGWKSAGGHSCLGASAYAPEAQGEPGMARVFSLVAGDGDPSCNPAAVVGGVAFDHIEIKPAEVGECPAPGTTLNGDAEGEGAWGFTIVVDDDQNGTGTGMIEDGVGEAGSRGARVNLNVGGLYGSASNSKISVPSTEQVPSPAIQYYLRASGGAVLSYVGSGSRGGFSDGAWMPAAPGRQTACLPPSMRGNLAEFSSTFASNGTGTATAVYDNLEVVNEPSCGTDPGIANPGFEAVATSLLGAYANAGTILGSASSSAARVTNDPLNAHTGSGVLQLRIDRICDDPAFVADVVVPPAVGAAGPALSFFYKAPPPVAYQLTAKPNFGSSPVLTYDGAYHRAVICLQPLLVGQRQTITFAMSTLLASPVCYQAITAEEAFVDDLSVTTDPSCPAI